MLTVIGTAAIDRNFAVGDIPARGGDVRARPLSVNPGGRAANTAARAALLGVTTRLICRLGDDDAGRQAADAMAAVERLEVYAQPSSSTPEGLIFITADGERTIVFCAQDPIAPSPDDATAGLLVDSKVVWIDVADDELRAGFARQASGSLRGLPLQHLAAEHAAGRRWDIIAGSLDDAQAPDEQTLLHAAVRVCVVTAGGRGGWLWMPTRRWRRFDTAPARAVADTCGAGDAFLGGLLAGLASDWPPELAVAAARRCGADAVCETGSWPTASTLLLGSLRVADCYDTSARRR